MVKELINLHLFISVIGWVATQTPTRGVPARTPLDTTRFFPPGEPQSPLEAAGFS